MKFGEIRFDTIDMKEGEWDGPPLCALKINAGEIFKIEKKTGWSQRCREDSASLRSETVHCDVKEKHH